MNTKLLSLLAIFIVLLAAAACTDNTTTNGNANMNANMARATPTAAPTATPGYSEEQAREERARAKESKETIGQSLEDAWVHAKVVTKLIGNSKTPERKINVDVVNGEVTLRGQVDTAEARVEAERVAKETDGVKKVVNQLKVVAPKPTPKAANSNKPEVLKGKTP
jgi:osmotically-inducible protein OsmY